MDQQENFCVKNLVWFPNRVLCSPLPYIKVFNLFLFSKLRDQQKLVTVPHLRDTFTVNKTLLLSSLVPPRIISFYIADFVYIFAIATVVKRLATACDPSSPEECYHDKQGLPLSSYIFYFICDRRFLILFMSDQIRDWQQLVIVSNPGNHITTRKYCPSLSAYFSCYMFYYFATYVANMFNFTTQLRNWQQLVIVLHLRKRITVNECCLFLPTNYILSPNNRMLFLVFYILCCGSFI